VLEFLIIVGASQPPGISKFHKLDAAHWALALIQRRHLLALLRRTGIAPLAEPLALRLVQVLVGALFPHVPFFQLIFTDRFSDVQRRLLGALLTFHRRQSPR